MTAVAEVRAGIGNVLVAPTESGGAAAINRMPRLIGQSCSSKSRSVSRIDFGSVGGTQREEGRGRVRGRGEEVCPASGITSRFLCV